MDVGHINLIGRLVTPNPPKKWFLGRVVILDTVCFKNSDEIALSCTVKETEAIWCFALFVTNLKIDNDPNFWEG